MIRKPSDSQCNGAHHYLQDHPQTPAPPKTFMSLSKFKDMLNIFFDIQSIVLAG